jgi:hypothetical protein
MRRIYRISIAGLMTIVGVVALDCATFVYAARPTDRSLDLAIFLLVVALPTINVMGVGMLLVLQPPGRQ